MTIPELAEFKYKSVIGSGSFCIVKKYVRKTGGQPIAIKQLKKEFINNDDYIYRFRREVELTNLFKGNENVIEIIFAHVETPPYLYSMDLADTNLFKFIQERNDKLNLSERLYLFDQIISVMRLAHSKNILHRDLAPNNILLFKKNNLYKVKISDFGLGKDIRSMSAFTPSSASKYGQVLYTAPEQRKSLKAASFKSDIYSLGKLLRFVLTGKDPDTVETNADEFLFLSNVASHPDPTSRLPNIEKFFEYYEICKSIKADSCKNIPIGFYVDLGLAHPTDFLS